MAETDKEKIIREYAAGEITWSALRRRGFDNYLDVLTELGKLGLRPPIAPMDGPNIEARQRGRALLRQALEDAKPWPSGSA
jgi:hypothetical protein